MKAVGEVLICVTSLLFRLLNRGGIMIYESFSVGLIALPRYLICVSEKGGDPREGVKRTWPGAESFVLNYIT